MVELMNAVLVVVGEDEDHPLSGFLEVVSDLVSLYEREHLPISPANPPEALRFLDGGTRPEARGFGGRCCAEQSVGDFAWQTEYQREAGCKAWSVFGVSPALFIQRV